MPCRVGSPFEALASPLNLPERIGKPAASSSGSRQGDHSQHRLMPVVLLAVDSGWTESGGSFWSTGSQAPLDPTTKDLVHVDAFEDYDLARRPSSPPPPSAAPPPGPPPSSPLPPPPRPTSSRHATRWLPPPPLPSAPLHSPPASPSLSPPERPTAEELPHKMSDFLRMRHWNTRRSPLPPSEPSSLRFDVLDAGQAPMRYAVLQCVNMLFSIALTALVVTSGVSVVVAMQS